jgi:hypothetical protein
MGTDRKMVSARNYVVLVALCLLGATAWAQSDVDPAADPNALPPAWGTPAPPPGFAPIPSEPAAPGQTAPAPVPDDSYFVPIQPAPGFDEFSGDDEGYGDFGAPPAEGPREVKDSFKLIEGAGGKNCHQWRNELLGPATFPDRGRCEFELARKVNRGMASIDALYDGIELFKLRKVIRGELRSRSESDLYPVRFTALKRTLQEASRKGCTCEE